MSRANTISELFMKLSGFRRKRMRLFFDIFKICKPIKILDVGGTPSLWEWYATEDSIMHMSITLLNLRCYGTSSSRGIKYKYMIGNALCLPFKNKSFDIVFSNSLIDHLYTFDNQKIFASEVMRVGKGYFIQTWNKKFPYEPHYLTPFIHFAPKTLQKRAIRYLTLYGLIAKPSQELINDLVDQIIPSTKLEIRTLFPNAYLIENKVLGITKDFIVYSSIIE
jgi:hypothetical protein